MGLDCKITDNYMKEKERFCGYMKKHSREYCRDCPLCENPINSYGPFKCESVGNERSIKVVQYFSDNGTIIKDRRTVLDDFMSKYPNAQLNERGLPDTTCAKKLGYDIKIDCGYKCQYCWNQDFKKIHRTSFILD